MSIVTRDRWINLCGAVQASGDPIPCFDQLTAAYSEPHRRYHNLRHIAECLQELDSVRDLASSLEAIELAIWFHDAVYDPKVSDNEEKSAMWAEGFLRNAHVAPPLVEKVSRLVLATKQHDISSDRDAPLLVDIDLSILGQPEKRFWEYEAQIRAEYSWVEESLFASKRAEILSGFLNRERIYSTDRFYTEYEQQARENLRASVAKLKS